MIKRDFNTWLSGFRNSIADYGYYIDFEKVYRNVDNIKVELNILNSLIGSKNIEQDFEELIKSKVSENTVKENLKTLKESLGVTYAYGKILNVNEYLVKDPEDARIPFRNLNDNKLYRISGADLIDRFRRRN